MKDLYSIALSPAQVARACEEYVLRTRPDLVAKAQNADIKTVLITVSTKRKPKSDKAAEAKQAGVRG